MQWVGLVPRHSLYGPWGPWAVCRRSRMIVGDGSGAGWVYMMTFHMVRVGLVCVV